MNEVAGGSGDAEVDIGPVSVVISEQELYEIERLAARITLLGFIPGARMSVRRAIEEAAAYALNAMKLNREASVETLEKFTREACGSRKQVLFRVARSSKAAIREVTKLQGWGATDTITLLASIHVLHAVLDAGEFVSSAPVPSEHGR